MSKKWYVVHAYSGFEKSVSRALQDRIQRAGMQDQFGQMATRVQENLSGMRTIKAYAQEDSETATYAAARVWPRTGT